FPRDVGEAQNQWLEMRNQYVERSEPPRAMTEPFPARDDTTRNSQRLNFLRLMVCLMIGTASLPHILTRYGTTATVQGARSSVGWTLFFVALLYVSAPALAVMLKYDVLLHLVGARYDNLP
ncbi:cation acetate symporter, partial [Pandoraea pneumonica]